MPRATGPVPRFPVLPVHPVRAVPVRPVRQKNCVAVYLNIKPIRVKKKSALSYFRGFCPGQVFAVF